MSLGPAFDQNWLAVMESSSMSDGARTALFVLAALLVLILACLVLFGVVLRKRSRQTQRQGRSERRVVIEAESGQTTAEIDYAPVDAGRSFSGSGAAGGGLEVARDDAQVCPTCRREFGPGPVYCPHDARCLVPVHEMHDPGRKDGSVCPSCHRSYDAGVRFCPHDAAELIAVSVYTATARAQERRLTGVIAKICPQCQRRFDLSATFCTHDSSELVVIN